MSYLRYFVILFLFLACKKESGDSMDIQVPFCLNSSPSLGIPPIDLEDDFYHTICDAQSPVDTSEWCEIIPKETLLLGEAAKCWIPQYQFDIGKTFTYNNAAGQSVKLTLTDKDHLLVNRIYDWEVCEENTNKRKGYCYESELYYITLKDAESNIEYYIEMRTRIIPSVDLPLMSTPELMIVAVFLSNNDSKASGALLWDKDFDETERLYMLTESSEELTLLNRTFENVICNSRPLVNKAYYNKELGLLGFEDEEEVLWVLQE